MITCVKVRQDIDAFLDGDLPCLDTERIEKHLRACRGCADELAFAEELRAGLRALPALNAPSGVLAAARARSFREASDAKEGSILPFQVKRKWPMLAALAAAAAVILMIAAPALLRQSPQANVGPQTVPKIEPQDVAKAEVELRWALAYIGAINRRGMETLQSREVEDNVTKPVNKAWTFMFAPAIQNQQPSTGEQT